MDNKNIEFEDGGLVCDKPSCDWQDLTIKFEELESYVNKPCPKCGENILNELDFNNAKKVRSAMEYFNTLSPDEINKLSENINPEVLNSDLFKDAKGLEFLFGEGDISMAIKHHNGVARVTEIKPVVDRFQIRISEILEIDKRKREINSRDLKEIDFLDDNGVPIQIDKKILEDFQYCGLNNTDLITSEFYKTGFNTKTENEG